MADNVLQFRGKAGDTEKITINLGYIDLGHIDLLVQEGFYSNRTDFIRTAIRNQIERHAETTKQTVARKSVELGLRHYSRDDLEAARSAGQTLHIRVLGLASIAQDVTPELARATIAPAEVLSPTKLSNPIPPEPAQGSDRGRLPDSQQQKAQDMTNLSHLNRLKARLPRVDRLAQI